MQLWYAPTSPFARKARIAAHELGFDAKLELVEVNPWIDERLRALNPLCKIPTLVLDDGGVLYESAVICDYLDELSGCRRLFPAAGAARCRALLLQGLADGACSAAGRLFADENRPANERSQTLLARFKATLDATLDRLESDTPDVGDPTIGEISLAALLGYLDFRWKHRDWRRGRPKLAAWFAAFEQRPSMQATRHHRAGAG
jgi:glutathione S-transferase